MTWYAWFILFENSAMHAFKEQDALRPDTALTLAELGLRPGALFGHLLKSEVIRAAPPDRFYMDVARQSRYLVRRRWTVALVAAGLVGFAFILAAVRG